MCLPDEHKYHSHHRTPFHYSLHCQAEKKKKKKKKKVNTIIPTNVYKDNITAIIETHREEINI